MGVRDSYDRFVDVIKVEGLVMVQWVGCRGGVVMAAVVTGLLVKVEEIMGCGVLGIRMYGGGYGYGNGNIRI